MHVPYFACFHSSWFVFLCYSHLMINQHARLRTRKEEFEPFLKCIKCGDLSLYENWATSITIAGSHIITRLSDSLNVYNGSNTQFSKTIYYLFKRKTIKKYCNLPLNIDERCLICYLVLLHDAFIMKRLYWVWIVMHTINPPPPSKHNQTKPLLAI